MVNKLNQRMRGLALLIVIFYLSFGVMDIWVSAAAVTELESTTQENFGLESESTILESPDSEQESDITTAEETKDSNRDTLDNNDFSDDTKSPPTESSTNESESDNPLDSALEQDSSDQINKFTLLLNDGTDIFAIEEALHRIDPELSITIIEEIKLVHIESEKKINKKIIISDAVIGHATSDYGTLVDLEQEGVALSDVYSGSDTVTLENIQGEIDSDTEDIDLLTSLAWNVDAVTEEKKSLDISTGKGIEIALIDSGVDYLHPFLADKIDLNDAKSYIPNDAMLSDTNGHGTMVAGVMSQIAPKAKITPYRVISESTGESLWTIEAIVQATNDGKDIINMSLGTYKSVSDESEYFTVKAFERAVEYAVSRDTILVSSAGNNGLNLDTSYQEDSIRHLPGSLEGVIAISSTTKDLEFASYCNYGSNVQFAAPGGDVILVNGMIDLSHWIYSTYPLSIDSGLGSLGIPQGYMFSYGTSLSAPAESAAIACFMAYYKDMVGESASRDIIMDYFKSSVMDLGSAGYDRYFGYGQINILNALSLVEDEIPPSGEIVSSTLELHTKVNAEDLVVNIVDNKDDPGDVKVYFKGEYDASKLGEQKINIILEDASQNKAYLSGIVTMVDTTPPTGKPQKATIYQGEMLKVDQLVYDIQDNAGAGQVHTKLVNDVDTSKIGLYSVAVSLMDQSDNEMLLQSEVEIIALLKEAGEPTVNPQVPREDTIRKNKAQTRSVKGVVPDTGDRNEIYLFIGIMSFCLLIVCIISRKKILKGS